MLAGIIHEICKSFRGHLEALVEAEVWKFEETMRKYVFYLVSYPKNELKYWFSENTSFYENMNEEEIFKSPPCT